MTVLNEMNENEQRFLIRLHQHTQGNSAVQVSLYEIGAGLGMSREQSSRAAETLMAFGFVEIRSLSGGNSISEEGGTEAERHITDSRGGTAPNLGNKPVLDENGRDAVSTILAKIKTMIPDMGLEFELMGELMADIKTAEAQMMSPRPKTAIVRECFISLADLLEKANKRQELKTVKEFLAD